MLPSLKPDYFPRAATADKPLLNVVGARYKDLHGDGDRWTPAEPAGIQLGWRLVLPGSRGMETKCCGTPAGMEQNCAGFPRDCSSI